MPGSDDTTLPAFHDDAGDRPRQRFGGYEIESELGRGGMGVVYRAHQASLKRTVALKMLTGLYGANEILRFIAEAETAAALNHANIVHIYEVGEQNDIPFFAMEFVEGGSLADRLKGGRFDPREAAEMMRTLARAVHHAHVHGVVHRDLKPHNVLLDQAGVPKIADFGIAKRIDDDSQRTTTGAIMGTPGYMAPEQAGGKSRNAGPPADVYSLGAMLYELLCGRPPFVPNESDTPVYIRVISEPAVTPSFHRADIPRDLEAICMMCLQKDPRDRFASAVALADDLQRFLDDEPIHAKPPPFVRRVAKWMKRHPLRVAAALAAIVAAVLGAVSWWRFEMYERPRIEFAGGVTLRHGGIWGVGPLDAEAAARRGVRVRLVRSGRRGQIVRAEVVNPKGKPANVRDILDYDVITTWLEGVTESTREAVRGRETVSLEASYRNEEVVDLVGRDRNDRVTVAIQYQSTARAAGGGATGLASFRNARNFDFAMPSGASRVQFERGNDGFDAKVAFFNSAGTAAQNGENVFGYAFEHDPDGNVVLVRNLDASGAPMANLPGVTQVRYAWNGRGQIVRSRFEDREGELVEVNGVASVETDYDTHGNVTHVRALDAAGKPANSRAADSGLPSTWSNKDLSYDAEGQVTAIAYKAVSAEGVERLVSRMTFAYDANGFPTDCQGYGPDGKPNTLLVFRYDDRGNAVERKTFDRHGALVGWKRDQLDALGNVVVSDELDPDGGVRERTTSVYQNDRLLSQSHTDKSGKPRAVASGHTRVDFRHHEYGYLIEERYSGFEASPLVFRVTFDERGRRLDETWLDAADRVMAGADGWARHRFTYDGFTSRLTSEEFLDAEGHPAAHRAGYTSVRYGYGEHGVLTERVYEGYGDAFEYSVVKEGVDPRGLARTRRYFDSGGNKAYAKGGYHLWKALHYDHDQIATSSVTEDYDPSRFGFFRARSVDTWDDLDLVRVVMTYEDVNGRPAPGPDGGSRLEREFDGGRERTRTISGLDAAAGAAMWRIETEWNGSVRSRRTHQAFDAAGTAIRNSGTERAARLEITYDAGGNVRSEVRSGMSETRIGYVRVEAEVAPDGTLASVVHRRADGTAVNVRAVITEVADGSQAKARGLRVGDTMVAWNGVPIANVYAFTYGKPFSGGTIEVERVGERIAIDGFAAGTLGISMIDRAVR